MAVVDAAVYAETAEFEKTCAGVYLSSWGAAATRR